MAAWEALAQSFFGSLGTAVGAALIIALIVLLVLFLGAGALVGWLFDLDRTTVFVLSALGVGLVVFGSGPIAIVGLGLVAVVAVSSLTG